jgi:hypothetical protein
MSDISDRDGGAEIVRFPASKNSPELEKRRARSSAYKGKSNPSGQSVQQPDPEYWHQKALSFRHAALTSRSNDDAAILIRRAEEFERMVALMEAERQPAVAAAPEKRLHAVVELVRDKAELVRDRAEQLRDKITELPLSPMPGGAAFAGVPTAALNAAPRPIARRAQRLVVTPAPAPAAPIARRAQRLSRG